MILQILFVILLLIIFYQDIQDRKVSLVVLLLSIFIGGFIHYTTQQPIVFLSQSAINLLFVGIIAGVLWMYAKLKMKANLFTVFGGGDLLFFIALAVSLPTLSFIMVFVFSIFFSLLIFLIFKKKFKEQTVPLAGLQSLFLSLVVIANYLFPSINLYG